MKTVRFRSPNGFLRHGELMDNGSIRADRIYDLEQVELLPPSDPTKILCIGLNYQGHIEETGKESPDRPMIFMKGINSLMAHNRTIKLPDDGKQYDYEGEIGIVIGRQCKNVTASQASEYIEGFTCFNDLSNRDDQAVEQNWIRGKAFDNAAPVGPVLSDPDEVPSDAVIETRVNGNVRQRSSRDRMIFSVNELIEEISSYLTLEPGDIIATGTPEGVGALEDGDIVEVEVEGVGVLQNEIRFADA